MARRLAVTRCLDEIVNTYNRPVSNGYQFPHPSISASNLRILMNEAEAVAARMVRTFRLPACDRDDLRQDILVDLLGRIRAFDPKRGTFGAFVGTIAGHRAARLTKNMRRQRATLPVISLDEYVAGVGITLTDMIRKADGVSASLSQPFHAFAEIEQRLDLTRALRGLGLRELSLCAKLTEYTPTEISRSGEYSRAGLYRRLKKIRQRLVAEGFSCS
jgi:DNA-directed RNA polymerase specialized sigma24 family protein